MNIYILRPSSVNTDPWSPWYDKSFGFIVRAENEENARKIADENSGDENGEHGIEHPWIDPQYSSCNILYSEGEECLIMEDFRSA